LYVSGEVVAGKKEINPIPERRPSEDERKSAPRVKPFGKPGGSIKVWRCKVCGYLCAMENPPLKCPICKADKDRFEEFY
jgi:ferredoxin-thioredoxin reductase catalytic chain